MIQIQTDRAEDDIGTLESFWSGPGQTLPETGSLITFYNDDCRLSFWDVSILLVGCGGDWWALSGTPLINDGWIRDNAASELCILALRILFWQICKCRRHSTYRLFQITLVWNLLGVALRWVLLRKNRNVTVDSIFHLNLVFKRNSWLDLW
jgi:hypothetical protein